jgi:hypothetical protein
VEDFTPRPKASQAVAAAKRARPTHDTEAIEPLRPTPIPARSYRLPALAAVLIVVAMLGMASYQLSRGPARPLQLQSTSAPASTLSEPATAAPAPTAEPTATIAPSPLPTVAPTAAPAPAEAPPAQSQVYIEPAPGPSVEQPVVEPPPAPAAEPATGQKQAPDRASHHATAVSRSNLPPPAREQP